MHYSFQVRLARLQDKEAVVAIARAFDLDDWLPYEFDTMLEPLPAPVGLYVAEQDGRVIGCAHLGAPWAGEGYLSAVRMDPAIQGQGLGTRFCGLVVEQAFQAGLGAVYLLSEVNNVPAHRVFYKNGFQRLGEWVVYGEIPLRRPGSLSDRVRRATAADLPWIQKLCPDDSLAGVVGSHFHPYVVRGLHEEDWQSEHLYVVEGDGFLLGLETEKDFLIRKLEATPQAAAELLAHAAAQTRCATWAVSLPARCEPLLASINPPPDQVFRPYVFVRKPGE